MNFLPAVFLLLTASLSPAVILATGDGTGNTTAPSAIWDNVGVLNNASGVYLGNRWVITAFHVGAGSINLAGNTYTWDGAAAQRLHNNGVFGMSAETDLVLFRLTTDPGLPSISIGGAPAVSDAVLMIGHGRDRAPTSSAWDVTVVPGDDNDVWTANPGGSTAGYAYNASNVRTMRWGNNTIDDASEVLNVGFGDVQSFYTTFDNIAGEGQGAPGDSGGAVFRGSSLIGIMHAVGSLGLDNQPANHAIFDNVTLAADLSFYDSQIQAILIPEPSAALLLVLTGFLGLRRRRGQGSGLNKPRNWLAAPAFGHSFVGDKENNP